ncbi:uncharacterized protein LOC143293374 [Babylonia areolata]|uniref:uncharacterized protein LOC143293374 n=1 Tax=Babylonia areolata TaxID=304850 RepID=UPI003FD23906
MINGKPKILGVYFSASTEPSLIKENWSEKIENILRIIKTWERRNPTLYGKIILAKTLLLSQLSYILQALAIPKITLNYINSIVYRFLWKRKYNNKKAFEKIKRSVLNLKLEEGGLTMINVEHQQRMFLAKWASKFVAEDRDRSFWTLLAKEQMSPFTNIHCTFNANIAPNEIQGLDKMKSAFWKEVLKATTALNTERQVENTRTEPIWNNKNIKYKGKTIFFTRWAKAGINYLQDLWTTGNLMTYEQIKDIVGSHAGLVLEYNALINAIPNEWKAEMNRDPTQHTVGHEINTDRGFLSTLHNKTIREIINKKQNHDICASQFWKRNLDININDYFTTAPDCTKNQD